MAPTRKHCSSSCLNCRVRKRKCDGQDVCGQCKKSNIECVRPSSDGRSLRPTSDEISRLREQNTKIETTLAKVLDLIAQKGDDRLTADAEQLLQASDALKNPKKPNKKLPVSIDASSGGEFSVFGPTSAFHSFLEAPTRLEPTHFPKHSLLNSSSLLASLSNFFRWLYPDVTVFIHRESFLNDLFSARDRQRYCSEELVYAIAGLGAKCAEADHLRELAPSFFERARTNILAEKLCLPQINTLQALLCLSLYELGDGNASSSWMFSGMAIRMGYDLGFQLNPKDWSIEDSATLPDSVLTHMDVMVRSRIYWGCYILDHFVSLIMGRPVTVRKTEASIPSSEVLPNSKNIDDFVFRSSENGSEANNLDASRTIEPLCSLSDCVGSLLTDIYSSDSGDDGSSYLNKAKLEKYNKILQEWRQRLPVSLRWTKSKLQSSKYNPTNTNYKLFYYVILICLNRPSLATEPHADKSSFYVCLTAIAELSTCLDKFNESGLPASILIVYSSILAIRVLLMEMQGSDTADPERIDQLRVCYTTVFNSCANWKLAARSLLLIRKKVDEMGQRAISQMLTTVDKSQNSIQSDFEQLDFGDISSWADQDNLFANFFDFVDH